MYVCMYVYVYALGDPTSADALRELNLQVCFSGNYIYICLFIYLFI